MTASVQTAIHFQSFTWQKCLPRNGREASQIRFAAGKQPFLPVLAPRNGRQMLYFRFVAGVVQTSLKLPLIGKGTADILEEEDHCFKRKSTRASSEIYYAFFKSPINFHASIPSTAQSDPVFKLYPLTISFNG